MHLPLKAKSVHFKAKFLFSRYSADMDASF